MSALNPAAVRLSGSLNALYDLNAFAIALALADSRAVSRASKLTLPEGTVV